MADLESAAGGNPGLRLLYDPAGPFAAAEVRHLSAARMLLRRWDVVHVCWPEWCVSRSYGAVLTAADAVRVLLQLWLVRVRGAALVWSVNNVRPHERDAVVDRYLELFSRLVDRVHCSSEAVRELACEVHPALRGVEHRIVPLGHYRGHYADTRPDRGPARRELGLPDSATVLLSIGRIRRHKDLVRLIQVFAAVVGARTDLLLLIAGACPDRRLRREIERECAGVPAVRTDLRYVSDDRLQCYLRAADVVIMPSVSSVNSASAMLALSFDRPVVLPHRGSFVELQERFGPRWVRTYDGRLSAAALRAVLAVGRPDEPLRFPDELCWPAIAAANLESFREVAGRRQSRVNR